MDNRDLLLAYQEAVRKAQISGRPVSKEEVMASVYPVLLDYRRRAIQDRGAGIQQGGLDLARAEAAQKNTQFGQTLAQKKEQFGQEMTSNRDIFNNNINLQRSTQDQGNRIGLLNVGVSGLGNLGISLAAMKQNDQMMELLRRKYPGVY